MIERKYLCERYESALYALPPRHIDILNKIPKTTKERCEEIRLRAEKPLLLTVGGAPMWVSEWGEVGFLPPKKPLYVSREEIAETYLNLCNHSVYSHQRELLDGYIMMKHSHRAGICGTVTDVGMRDISSINIRISKQIIGCADKIVLKFEGGMLLAGPPGSGKTTLLRDAVRQLSSVKRKRISVIDSRGEIAAICQGVAENDLGENTDILTGTDKAHGIEMAVRTMYPQIVAFDEIGTDREVEEVIGGLNSGVSVLTTAHIGSREDLMLRPVTRRLLESGAIKHVAILSKPGGDIEILTAKEILE